MKKDPLARQALTDAALGFGNKNEAPAERVAPKVDLSSVLSLFNTNTPRAANDNFDSKESMSLLLKIILMILNLRTEFAVATREGRRAANDNNERDRQYKAA
jgi:hypothetical protein